jgi:hypothetical protein
MTLGAPFEAPVGQQVTIRLKAALEHQPDFIWTTFEVLGRRT